MIYLTKEQIILLHEKLIKRYGGSSGIRDEGLLDSAINAPLQSFNGNDFFPTVTDKAVRLCVGLVKNHPFIDGNKRIGALALLTILDLNKYQFKSNSTELSSVILDFAAGKIDDNYLLQWVMNRID